MNALSLFENENTGCTTRQASLRASTSSHHKHPTERTCRHGGGAGEQGHGVHRVGAHHTLGGGGHVHRRAEARQGWPAAAGGQRGHGAGRRRHATCGRPLRPTAGGAGGGRHKGCRQGCCCCCCCWHGCRRGGGAGRRRGAGQGRRCAQLRGRMAAHAERDGGCRGEGGQAGGAAFGTPHRLALLLQRRAPRAGGAGGQHLKRGRAWNACGCGNRRRQGQRGGAASRRHHVGWHSCCCHRRGRQGCKVALPQALHIRKAAVLVQLEAKAAGALVVRRPGAASAVVRLLQRIDRQLPLKGLRGLSQGDGGVGVDLRRAGERAGRVVSVGLRGRASAGWQAARRRLASCCSCFLLQPGSQQPGPLAARRTEPRLGLVSRVQHKNCGSHLGQVRQARKLGPDGGSNDRSIVWRQLQVRHLHRTAGGKEQQVSHRTEHACISRGLFCVGQGHPAAAALSSMAAAA